MLLNADADVSRLWTTDTFPSLGKILHTSFVQFDNDNIFFISFLGHEYSGAWFTCRNIHSGPGFYDQRPQCAIRSVELQHFQQRCRNEWERLPQSDVDDVTLLVASY